MKKRKALSGHVDLEAAWGGQTGQDHTNQDGRDSHTNQDGLGTSAEKDPPDGFVTHNG